MRKFILVLTIAFCFAEVKSTTITLSGETEVCPLETQTYTATATGAFGLPVNGSFEWGFKENNQWTYFGSIPCPNGGNNSSSMVNYEWLTDKPQEIRVRFIPRNNPFCPITTKTVTMTSLVKFPGDPRDADGKLIFCGSNETKTITIPGIPGSSTRENCYWHYAYEWFVPAGWTVVPSDDTPYDTISGGIRTFATSVEITTPSTSLSNGYSGNYFIRVKTEDGWPWERVNEGQVWIGDPNSVTGSLSGPSSVETGSLVWYSVPSQSQADGTFDWSAPIGFQTISWGDGTRKVQYLIGDKRYRDGWVQVWKTNACGNGGAKVKWVTVTAGGGCGLCQIVIMSPNPASTSLNISYLDRETSESLDAEEFDEERTYLISDLQGNAVKSFSSYKTNLEVNLTDIIKGGIYILNIVHGSLGTDQYRFIIDK